MYKIFYAVMLFTVTLLTLSFSQNASARGMGGGMGNADYSDMRSSASRNNNNFGQDAAAARNAENQGYDDGSYGGSSPIIIENQQDSVDKENNAIFNSYSNTPD